MLKNRRSKPEEHKVPMELHAPGEKHSTLEGQVSPEDLLAGEQPVHAGGKSTSSAALPGWPGYRIRGPRTGLDPLDNNAEMGHSTGIFLHGLFTGRLVTQSRFHLAMLAVFGLLLTTPLAVALVEELFGRHLPNGAWWLLLPIGIVGLAALGNFWNNLRWLLSKK